MGLPVLLKDTGDGLACCKDYLYVGVDKVPSYKLGYYAPDLGLSGAGEASEDQIVRHISLMCTHGVHSKVYRKSALARSALGWAGGRPSRAEARLRVIHLGNRGAVTLWWFGYSGPRCPDAIASASSLPSRQRRSPPQG